MLRLVGSTPTIRTSPFTKKQAQSNAGRIYPAVISPSVHKAVSEKHTETGIAGHKQEYESKGSYFCSLYAVKTAIGTLVFLENLL